MAKDIREERNGLLLQEGVQKSARYIRVDQTTPRITC